MATTAMNADQLGLVQGLALDGNQQPLPNTLIYVKDYSTDQPVRIFGSSSLLSMISKEGIFRTDTKGRFSFWARLGHLIYLYALDSHGKVSFRTMAQQPGSWIDNSAEPTGALNAITSAALIGPPNAAQLAIGGSALFYDPLAPEILYRINGSGTAFVQLAGTGGGSGGGTGPTDPNRYDSYLNADSAAMVKGTPIYATGTSTARPAIGNTVGRKVIGLYSDDADLNPGGAGNFLVEGSLIASMAQWQLITGNAGGLIPGARYYLDLLVPGKLNASVPLTSPPVGSYQVSVGYASSPVEFVLDLQSSIRLA